MFRFKRRIIVLCYIYDENWVGGAYYIQNLAIAFSKLKDKNKPAIYLVSTLEDYNDFIEITKYPYIDPYSKFLHPTYNIIERVLNKISRLVSNRNVFEKTGYDLLFPVFQLDPAKSFKSQLFWIPDFRNIFFRIYFLRKR